MVGALGVTASCQHVKPDKLPLSAVQLLHHPVSQPVVLDFFFNGCEACQQNEADLEELVAELDGVAIFAAISVDCDVSEVDSWKAKFHPPYPILDGCKGNLAEIFEVEGYPTTIVLDINGNILEKKLGLLSIMNVDFVHWSFHTNADAIKAAVKRAYSP